MENIFTRKMADKTTAELEIIVDNKDDYEIDAYLAAFKELKLRQGRDEQNITPTGVPSVTKEEEELESKKESFEDTMTLLIPNKRNFITPVIMFANFLIFIIMIASGVHIMEPSVDSLIKWGGNLRGLTIDGQQWRFLSSTFLHAGLIHLLFNMYALLNIGHLLEAHFGKRNYLLLYLASGVAASIASTMAYDNIVSVGASGAIFGMYGLLLSLLLSKTITIQNEVRSQLTYSILFFVGYNLFYGLTQEGIDNAAHIGGLVSGMIFGLFYFLTKNNTMQTKLLSFAIAILISTFAIASPHFISNRLANYNQVIEQFSANEQKALWMFQEEISYHNEQEAQKYCDRITNESIVLWEENLNLLATLTDLPVVLEEQVSILNEYCHLRIEFCEAQQLLIKHDNLANVHRVELLGGQIEQLLNRLEGLNHDNS